MPKFSTLDPNVEGKKFYPKVIAEQDFRNNGVLYGKVGSLYWSVIDPRRHPLYVWEKQGNGNSSYSDTARSLGATVFSNGPMMVKWKVETIKKVGGGIFISAVIAGAVLGGKKGLGAGAWAGPKGALAGAVLGAIIGALMAGAAVRYMVASGWDPYDLVVGKHHGIHDEGIDFTTTAYSLYDIGRAGVEFKTYSIDTGRPDDYYIERVSDLVPAVLNYMPMSHIGGSPGFHPEYEKFIQHDHAVAWGLVPINNAVNEDRLDKMLDADDFIGVDLKMPGQNKPLDGVLICMGTREQKFTSAIAGLLAKIRTRDAVFMDGSNSSMIGAASEVFVKPAIHKELLQKYGLYCK